MAMVARHQAESLKGHIWLATVAMVCQISDYEYYELWPI